MAEVTKAGYFSFGWNSAWVGSLLAVPDFIESGLWKHEASDIAQEIGPGLGQEVRKVKRLFFPFYDHQRPVKD